MERSIKRVEKLVHATNSALAEMKLSLMFDDMSAGKGEDLRWSEGFHPTLGEKGLDGDDLTQCQKEFKSETTEMLAKIEKMFGSNELSRKNAQALDKIKEINRKMKASNMEKSESGETQQSRQKLLSLLAEEKYSPRVTSGKGSARSKRTPSLDHEKITAEKPPCVPKKVEAPPETSKTPVQSKEELKSKILETQEIVDRGFQTALQLAHKVDNIAKLERREKSSSPDRAEGETHVRELERKADSNEAIGHEKHGKERKRKRDLREKREERELEHRLNIRVIDVKRKEVERKPKKTLQVQHLPSLHIRGELQLQKVHNLEISSAGNAAPESTNIAVTFFSHEQMEKEKVDEMLGQVKKKSSCTDGSTPGNFLECYHCGNLLRFRKSSVDPRKVDEILRMCNFNVFDPRIEEFVEKCGDFNHLSRSPKTQPPYSVQTSPQAAPAPEASTKKKKTEEVKGRYEKVETESRIPILKKSERRSTLQNLSEQVYQKYKMEAATIEGHHVKLDTILQSLFRKVDESRDFFESCHFLKSESEKLDTGKSAKLSTTKPILFNVDGNSTGIMKKPSPEEEIIYAHKDVDRSSEVKAEGQYGPPPVFGSPVREAADREDSRIIRVTHSETCQPEPTKEIERTGATSSDHPSLEVKHREVRKQESETKTASATQTCTTKSRHTSKRKTVSRKQNTEESLLTGSRVSKSRDWVCGAGEAKVSGPATADKRNAKESGEASRKEARKENGQPDTSSTSSTRLLRNRRVGPGSERVHVPSSSSLKGTSGNEDGGKKSVGVPVAEERKTPSEKKATSEGSSERSENNYESDFESTTNDPDEQGDDNTGQEPFPLGNKLSTITEVDSELEKKLGDDQKTSKSKSLEANLADAERSKQEELSSKGKQPEVGVLGATELRTKGAPMELVTSLRDILSALQEQFARTESLAERLTENQVVEKKQSPEPESVLAEGPKVEKWETLTDANLFENLQSARKDQGGGSSRAPKSGRDGGERAPGPQGRRSESLSDEGGSSLGEIVVSHHRKSESSSISENSFLKLASGRKSSRHSSGRRESNNPRIQGFKLGVSSEDISYSEGEIPSENVLNMDRISIHSVGEVSH